jgi:hypothetical protein
VTADAASQSPSAIGAQSLNMYTTTHHPLAVLPSFRARRLQSSMRSHVQQEHAGRRRRGHEGQRTTSGAASRSPFAMGLCMCMSPPVPRCPFVSSARAVLPTRVIRSIVQCGHHVPGRGVRGPASDCGASCCLSHIYGESVHVCTAPSPSVALLLLRPSRCAPHWISARVSNCGHDALRGGKQ